MTLCREDHVQSSLLTGAMTYCLASDPMISSCNWLWLDESRLVKLWPITSQPAIWESSSLAFFIHCKQHRMHSRLMSWPGLVFNKYIICFRVKHILFQQWSCVILGLLSPRPLLARAYCRGHSGHIHHSALCMSTASASVTIRYGMITFLHMHCDFSPKEPWVICTVQHYSKKQVTRTFTTNSKIGNTNTDI